MVWTWVWLVVGLVTCPVCTLPLAQSKLRLVPAFRQSGWIGGTDIGWMYEWMDMNIDFFRYSTWFKYSCTCVQMFVYINIQIPNSSSPSSKSSEVLELVSSTSSSSRVLTFLSPRCLHTHCSSTYKHNRWLNQLAKTVHLQLQPISSKQLGFFLMEVYLTHTEQALNIMATEMRSK